MDQFALVVKVTDQCNLHCPYCYYYAGGATGFRTRKHKQVEETLGKLVDALAESKAATSSDHVMIILHGGEPLLLPKPVMAGFLAGLREKLGAGVELSIQTNGVLLDEEWISILGRHNVAASVSIDGPAHKHDEFRIHANGSGSHAEAVRGFQLLQAASERGEISPPGILAVYDPEISAEAYFDHFVNELGSSYYDLLFPDDPQRFPDVRPVANAFRQTVERTWQLWTSRDDPGIYVRFIGGALFSWFNQRPHLDDPEQMTVLVADMSGDVYFEDDLRPYMPLGDLKVGSWLEDGFDRLLVKSQAKTGMLRDYDPECVSCEFFQACRGGQFSFRLDPETGKFGKSVLCDVYKTGFGHARDVIERLRLAA